MSVVALPCEKLTAAEKQCCNFAGYDLVCGNSAEEAQQWRDELLSLPRSERCNDCPVKGGRPNG